MGRGRTREPADVLRRRGGAETFTTIVSRFYDLVAEDEVLRPMYPRRTCPRPRTGPDVPGAVLGRPADVPDQRGHPRLRMRHAPYRIGPIERDAWLRCMHTAVASIDATTLDDERRAQLLGYLEMAAQHMVNSGF